MLNICDIYLYFVYVEFYSIVYTVKYKVCLVDLWSGGRRGVDTLSCLWVKKLDKSKMIYPNIMVGNWLIWGCYSCYSSNTVSPIPISYIHLWNNTVDIKALLSSSRPFWYFCFKHLSYYFHHVVNVYSQDHKCFNSIKWFYPPAMVSENKYAT